MAYRNDADARELVLAHLEVENKQLIEQNRQLVAENLRHRTLGREFATSDPATAEWMRIQQMQDLLASQMERYERAIRHFRRTTIVVVALVSGMAAQIWLWPNIF